MLKVRNFVETAPPIITGFDEYALLPGVSWPRFYGKHIEHVWWFGHSGQKGLVQIGLHYPTGEIYSFTLTLVDPLTAVTTQPIKLELPELTTTVLRPCFDTSEWQPDNQTHTWLYNNDECELRLNVSDQILTVYFSKDSKMSRRVVGGQTVFDLNEKNELIALHLHSLTLAQMNDIRSTYIKSFWQKFPFIIQYYFQATALYL
jgi:hypothetical protein